jgi:glycosyltransferase involved in cell wall biosynthesis
MNSPLLSVGIAFLNAEKCLLDSIRSIFAQTFQDWELILVDDGSTDGSLKLAQSIYDPRVRVLPADGRNKGLGARLNQIVQAAGGEFIARMDADDLSHPDRFSTQLEFLENHSDVDVVGAASYVLNRRRQPVQKLIVPETHEAIFKDKFRGVSLVHPTIMTRALWFRRFPYGESFIRCQDYELWLRSCNDALFANILKPLYFKDDYNSFSLARYVKSKLTGRKLIKACFVLEPDKPKYVTYAMKLYWQIARYTVYAMLGLSHIPVQRRYQFLSPQESVEANEALHTVKRTHVPIVRKE